MRVTQLQIQDFIFAVALRFKDYTFYSSGHKS